MYILFLGKNGETVEKKMILSDEKIRQHLLCTDDDPEIHVGSSEDEDLLCDEEDDPLGTVDVEDDRDPDFDPNDLSSSESETEVTGFDLELAEEALPSHIRSSEIPSDVEIDSTLDAISKSSKEETSKPKPKKKRGKLNSGKQNAAQSDNAPSPSNAPAVDIDSNPPKNQMKQKSGRKRKIDSGREAVGGDKNDEVKNRKNRKGEEKLSENNCITTFDGPTVSGKPRKNGSSFIWKTQPLPSNQSVPAKNIVHIRPGPVGHDINIKK